MTAEVAILNRQAIALAADSAVTVTTFENKSKIFNSANKLFALSHSQPVGIMIYGGAALTGIPWETLIKLYRQQLGQGSFPTVQEYSLNFIEFLTAHINLFTTEDRLDLIRSTAFQRFIEIRENTFESIRAHFKGHEKITTRQVGDIFRKHVRTSYQDLQDLPYAHDFSEQDGNILIDQYSDEIKTISRQIFEEFSVTNKTQEQLLSIVSNSMVKDTFKRGRFSGVVIAGYGTKEVFPGLNTYEFECVVGQKIKYRVNLAKSCNNFYGARIIPFAQEDMVFTFVEGIDPGFDQFSVGAIQGTLEQYFNAMIQASPVQNRTLIQEHMNELTQRLLQEFMAKTRQYRQEQHVDPILNMVGILPKDELASMAEALVNLTSLKRRVSTDAETVGGPTDVAVISKGDGFIWVRRKHYFDQNLNPDFFARRQKNMLA
jgi:hypothetical protein